MRAYVCQYFLKKKMEMISLHFAALECSSGRNDTDGTFTPAMCCNVKLPNTSDKDLVVIGREMIV